MGMPSNEYLKQIDDLLATGSQMWLFGAGISKDAGIPLMQPLSERVFQLAENEEGIKTLLNALKEGLHANSHIEHLLSHLADYIAIAQRTTDQKITIDSTEYTISELREAHTKVLHWIAQTIRWGYIPAEEEDGQDRIGSRDEPIVDVKHHRAFVKAVFHRSQAGIAERRSAVRFFSTNYDTLLEDALALESISYWDGFLGGAVAYRSFQYGQDEPQSGYRAHIIKLHGSIDWHLGSDDRVWRVRDSDLYPEKNSRVLIYPQATKYLATQRDPFAAQFDCFRRMLGSGVENVLAICGYAFGDEHINQEIEMALQHPDNKTTVVAFAMDRNHTLESWQKRPWGKRLYVLAQDGLYVGQEGPVHTPLNGNSLDWWKFDGVTKLLNNGAETCIK